MTKSRGVLISLAVLPVAVGYGTTVHELCHALAAVLSGGHVLDIRLMPAFLGRLVFGYTNTAGGDPRWIRSAPALFSACMATFALAWVPELKPGWTRSACVIFFYVVPLFDVAMALWGPMFVVVTSDLWALQGHFVALALASFVFLAGHLFAAPRVGVRRTWLVILVMTPALRFAIFRG